MKLYKSAVRIIKPSWFSRTNYSTVDRLEDIVYLRTLDIMYRIANRNIPVVIEDIFMFRKSKYNSRGLLLFLTSIARTNVKYRCVSVLGVKLWMNGLIDGLKL